MNPSDLLRVTPALATLATSTILCSPVQAAAERPAQVIRHQTVYHGRTEQNRDIDITVSSGPGGAKPKLQTIQFSVDQLCSLSHESLSSGTTVYAYMDIPPDGHLTVVAPATWAFVTVDMTFDTAGGVIGTVSQTSPAMTIEANPRADTCSSGPPRFRAHATRGASDLDALHPANESVAQRVTLELDHQGRVRGGMSRPEQHAAAPAIGAAASSDVSTQPAFGAYQGTTSQGYAMSFALGMGGWDGVTPSIKNYLDTEDCIGEITGTLVNHWLYLQEYPLSADGSIDVTDYVVTANIRVTGAASGDDSYTGTSRNVSSMLVLGTQPLRAELCVPPDGAVSWTAVKPPQASSRGRTGMPRR